jgi:hypothetical protein
MSGSLRDPEDQLVSDLTERARALANAATPGPWVWRDKKTWDESYGGLMHNNEYVVRGTADVGGGEWFTEVGEEDAAFIAWCREGVPALLNENDALRARLAEAESEPKCVHGETSEHWILGNNLYPATKCPGPASREPKALELADIFATAEEHGARLEPVTLQEWRLLASRAVAALRSAKAEEKK